MKAYRFVSTLRAFATLARTCRPRGLQRHLARSLTTSVDPGPTNTDGGAPDGGNYLSTRAPTAS